MQDINHQLKKQGIFGMLAGVLMSCFLGGSLIGISGAMGFLNKTALILFGFTAVGIGGALISTSLVILIIALRRSKKMNIKRRS